MKTQFFSKNQREYLRDKSALKKNLRGNAKKGILNKLHSLTDKDIPHAMIFLSKGEKEKILKNMFYCFTLSSIKRYVKYYNLELSKIIRDRKLKKSLVSKYSDWPLGLKLSCLKLLRKSTKRDKEILRAINNSPNIFLNGKIFHDLRYIRERTRSNKNKKEKIFLVLKKISNPLKVKDIIHKIHSSVGFSKPYITKVLIDFFERGIILDAKENKITFLERFIDKFKKKTYTEKNHLTHWGIELFPFKLNNRDKYSFENKIVKFNPVYKSKPTNLKNIEIIKKKYKGGGKFLLKSNYS